MKITYLSSTLPEHIAYIARFVSLMRMEGCAIKLMQELRGNRDTNTIQTHHWGLMHKPRPRRSIARPSGHVSSQEGHDNHPLEG